MKTLLTLLTAALLLAGAASCADGSDSRRATDTMTGRTEPNVAQQGTPQSATTVQSKDTDDVVRAVRESVVRVRAGGRAQPGPFGRVASGEGAGTGFIVDQGGYIVTNNHVVTLGGNQPAPRLDVDLWDGRTFDATLVGRDERTDLAVLKIDAPDLKPLPFASPESVVVGEDVVAIGFALDLGSSPTVTAGVVSAKDRVITETIEVGGAFAPIEISGAIQTDAAINPGNSGGPLLNLRSEVVGVNTAGLVGAAGQPVQGIFFAVSSGVAEPIVKELIERGNVERGYLGIHATTITREIARAKDLRVQEGAGVEFVEPGSAAARAGLQAGDVVTRIGDVPIRNVGDLSVALFRNGPGSTVQVALIRNGETRTIELTPAARPAPGR